MGPPVPEVGPQRSRFGLRARLLALLLPAVAALLALDSWNDYHALHDVVQDAYDQAMLEPVSALEDSIDIAADGAIRVNAAFSVQSMFDATKALHKHLHVGLTPLQANASPGAPPAEEISLLGAADLPPPPAAAKPAEGASPYVWYDGVYRGYPVRVLALQRTVMDGYARPYRVSIQAAESTGLRDQAQAASLRQELLRDVRMVLVMIALVWVGVRVSLRPLERLRQSVQASPPGSLRPLDANSALHEVAPLVEAINHHIARHREMLTRQSQFLADASHQLRTPLAIMLTQAGYALREPDPQHLLETMRAIAAQLSRSRRMSEQLLSLAHADQSDADETPATTVDLNGVARQVVLQYLPLAHEKNLDLGWVDARGELADESDAPDDLDELGEPGELGVPGALGAVGALGDGEISVAAMVAPVAAHSGELHEALSNLVHNAIQYTPAGGRITVTVRLDPPTACAEVQDSGPGIPADQREQVFERFQHLGDRPGKARHGAGLGLAIARAYARRNGGEIELAAGDGQAGLRAMLRVPLARPPTHATRPGHAADTGDAAAG